MWKSKEQKAEGRRQKAASTGARALLITGRPVRTFFCLLLSAYCLLTAAACRRDMQDQPKMKPYRSTVFFKDGLSSRPLVEGTVPRGFLKTDTEFFTGKKAGRTNSTPGNAPAPAGNKPVIAANATGPAAYPDDVEVFPLPVTKEVVERGKQRYEIFCTVCHGPTGNGDGMIVRRGFRRAASFNDDRLRQAPVGHFFDAVTNGWGAMPAYAPQIPAQDRWAIIAYIRALQLSQQSQQPQPAAASASATPATQSGGQHQ